jgi:hemerythrin superfamily protein
VRLGPKSFQLVWLAQSFEAEGMLMPNAITMLKSDHATVKRLLRELEETTARGTKVRERLVGEIERELKIHSQLEEELFYPTFKKVAEDTRSEHLFYEATEEHHVVDMVLPALKAANPKSPEFEAKAKVLKDLVEHHAREEETQMFTQARRLMNDEQLNALGELMQQRKESIQTMWDNPVLRPMKKVQGVVHKMLPTKVKNVKANAIARMAEGGEAR